MDRQEIQERLAGEVAQTLLRRRIVRLAYIARDGTPRAIPMGYSWDGEAFLMCTTTNSAKVPALQAKPDVALTLDTDDFPPLILLARGRAELELVDGIPDVYMQVNDPSYMTPEQRAGWEAEVRSLYDAMYVIRILPTWVKVIDFETTLPSAVDELIRRRDAATS